MPTTEPPLAGPHERWCGRTGVNRQAAIQEAIAKSKRSFLDLLKKSVGYAPGILEQEQLAVRPDTEATIRSEIVGKTGSPIQEELYADSLRKAEESLTVQDKHQSREQPVKGKKEQHKEQNQIR